MTTAELPAREAMEFDAVIVGAGPAGLAAAIRLKQIAADKSVVVVEKGSEVGAHILSGAVIDPIGLDSLIPEWRGEDTPIKTAVTADRFYALGPSGALRLPNCSDAAADEQSRQFHRLARRRLPLSREEGRSARCRNLSGLCRRRGLVRERRGRRHRHRRHGDRQGRPSQARLCPRHGAARQIHAVRRRRARQPDQGADRTLRPAQGHEPQKFGIGLKELWQVAPEQTPQAGWCSTRFGWPLDNRTGGGSFLYHFDDNLVAVGFVVHLNYRNPYLSPFEEFQRFKTHPLVRDTFAGGKRICYGARAITEGGWQSVPKLAFPGGALIGCAAGFVNVPRIKGSHNAMLSGMLAAEQPPRR